MACFLLTIQGLNTLPVIIWQSVAVCINILVCWKHERSSVSGVIQAQSVTKLVCRHQKQIHTWKQHYHSSAGAILLLKTCHLLNKQNKWTTNISTLYLYILDCALKGICRQFQVPSVFWGVFFPSFSFRNLTKLPETTLPTRDLKLLIGGCFFYEVSTNDR